jgi:hypothetical protein
MRVARFETRMTWSEEPPSRSRHLIGNLEVAPLENRELQAKTASLAYHSHLETGACGNRSRRPVLPRSRPTSRRKERRLGVAKGHSPPGHCWRSCAYNMRRKMGSLIAGPKRHQSRQLHGRSLDYLVGAGEDRWRDRKAGFPRGLQVDDQLEGRRLLDRQIGRIAARPGGGRGSCPSPLASRCVFFRAMRCRLRSVRRRLREKSLNWLMFAEWHALSPAGGHEPAHDCWNWAKFEPSGCKNRYLLRERLC